MSRQSVVRTSANGLHPDDGIGVREEVRERFFDHVLAVSTYEQEGATVVAANAHEQVVRDAADNGELLDFHGVDDRFVLEDNSRRVEIIDIGPTAHTEHLLVTWLPDDGILFEADHFAMPRSGPVPPAVSSTKSFAKALQENDISAKLIVSAHSPRPGTPDDLQDALDKNAVVVSQKPKPGSNRGF